MASVSAVAVLVLATAIGNRFLVVRGGSMRPALHAGDLVMVRHSDVASAGRGDIVVFEPSPGSASVTHRVVGVRLANGVPRLVTKGDANGRPDTKLCGSAELRGKVVAVVPKVGLIAGILHAPAGFVLGVVLPGLGLALAEVRGLRRSLRCRSCPPQVPLL